MNAIKYFYSVLLMLVVLAACKKVSTDDIAFVDTATASTKDTSSVSILLQAAKMTIIIKPLKKYFIAFIIVIFS